MTRYAGENSERRVIWAVLMCGAVLFSESRVACTAEHASPPESAWPHVPSDAELEERQAVIGEIYFNIGDIFNELDPREDKSLYRLANRLHIKTRESAIRVRVKSPLRSVNVETRSTPSGLTITPAGKLPTAALF